MGLGRGGVKRRVANGEVVERAMLVGGTGVVGHLHVCVKSSSAAGVKSFALIPFGAPIAFISESRSKQYIWSTMTMGTMRPLPSSGGARCPRTPTIASTSRGRGAARTR